MGEKELPATLCTQRWLSAVGLVWCGGSAAEKLTPAEM